MEDIFEDLLYDLTKNKGFRVEFFYNIFDGNNLFECKLTGYLDYTLTAKGETMQDALDNAKIELEKMYKEIKNEDDGEE